jgi:hypothetical protein
MQPLGRLQRPVRIAQEFPRQQHQVSLPFADNLVRLCRVGNHTDADSRYAPDALMLQFMRLRVVLRKRDGAAPYNSGPSAFRGEK